MTKWMELLSIALVASLFAGCLDQKVDTGEDVDAVVPDEQNWITVSLDGDEVQVNLSELPRQQGVEVVDGVRMSDALLEAASDSTLDTTRCDFVASDGFRTSTKGAGCEPLVCRETEAATIELSTRDVFWEPALNMRGCYHPKDLMLIEMVTE